jgi:hypothetical protein
MPMATTDALMGFGVPAQLASLLGGNPNVLTTTGTTVGAAAVLKSRNTELSTAASQTGAIPPTTAAVMEPYFITNPASTSAVLYVQSGHTLNGSLNGTKTLAQNSNTILWQYKKTFWVSITASS